MKTFRYTYPVSIASMALCFAWSAFAETGVPGSNPQFMFMQNAARTSFKDGKLTLISPSTVYFSDRPARLAGNMTCRNFVGMWTSGDDSLQKDPPNAVLSVFVPDGKPTQTVVTLKNPRLDENSNLVYDVSVLKGSMLAESAGAALLIDDARMPAGRWASCFNLGYLSKEFACSAGGG